MLKVLTMESQLCSGWEVKQKGLENWVKTGKGQGTLMRPMCTERERERVWKAFPFPTEAQSQQSCLGSCLGTCHVKFSLAGLVKAVNTAVDLIVAHFGTSRDPGVKVSKTLES